MPLASTSRLRLTPCLARSVGFFPVFFPPEGCLGHAPVHRQPGPVDALQVIVGHQTRLPQGLENAGFDPFLEAVVGGGSGAELGGIERLPLAAGAQDVQDGFHAQAIVLARAPAAEAMSVLVLGEEELHGCPEVVGDTPVVGDGTSVHSQGLQQVRNRSVTLPRSCSPSRVIRIGSYHLRVNKYIDRQLFVEALGLVDRFRPIAGYGYVSMGGAYLEDCRVLHQAHKITRMYSFDMDAKVLQRQAVNRPYGFISYEQRTSRQAIEGFQDIRAALGAGEMNAVVWLDYTNPAQRKAQLQDLGILVSRLIEGDVVRITLNAHRTTLGENRVYQYELEKVPAEQVENGQFPATLAGWRLAKLQEQLGEDLPPEREDPIHLETEEGLYRTMLRTVKRVVLRSLQPRPELLAFPLLSTAYSDQHGMVTATFMILRQEDAAQFTEAARWAEWVHKPGPEWDDYTHIEVPHLSLRERHVIHALIAPGGGFEANAPNFMTDEEFVQYSAHYVRYPTFAPLDVM
jgi:hypothetical protein